MIKVVGVVAMVATSDLGSASSKESPDSRTAPDITNSLFPLNPFLPKGRGLQVHQRQATIAAHHKA